MTILKKIIVEKRKEIIQRKTATPIAELVNSPNYERKCISLKQRLLANIMGIIAEVKRKSPSKERIKQNADAAKIAYGYCQNGAAGISILTDKLFFGGTPEDLIAARKVVNCPILRKDFIIDAYQLYEAKAMGADVILLIAAALSPGETEKLATLAKNLGMEVLLEIHNEDELLHINQFVDMVGVNNRNLKTFDVNIETSKKLAALIPDEFVKISESGISDTETIIELSQYDYRGFLMGESFMKEANPPLKLKEFINTLQ